MSQGINKRIQVVLGDITQLKVDAVVNAANSSLLGGGGVDGAIHREAGPKLLDECVSLGGCPVGEARHTKGYELNAKMIIHTVGPVWRGGNMGENQLLRSCYSNSLNIAKDHSIKSIAFPSISTGAYGYPFHEACTVALDVIIQFTKKEDLPANIIMVCYSRSDFEIMDSIFLEKCSNDL